MAFGILQAVLLGFGIEMRAGRFEVGGIALGVLMKVDGVLAGRKIMKAELYADTWSLPGPCCHKVTVPTALP